MMVPSAPDLKNSDDRGWPLVIPPHVADSRFFARGGVDLLRGLLTRQTFEELAADALALRPKAKRAILEIGDDAWDGRGGTPARALSNVAGTTPQFDIFRSETVLRALSEVTGLDLAPAGAGTYSYYHEEGDFLALHRDVTTCDVTVIACLENRHSSRAGSLCLYPADVQTRLSEIRRRTERRCITVDFEPGDIAVLLGSVVPHEVTPLAQGQSRTVSLMCYRVAGWP